jgi:hypothetical protein
MVLVPSCNPPIGAVNVIGHFTNRADGKGESGRGKRKVGVRKKESSSVFFRAITIKSLNYKGLRFLGWKESPARLQCLLQAVFQFIGSERCLTGQSIDKHIQDVRWVFDGVPIRRELERFRLPGSSG